MLETTDEAKKKASSGGGSSKRPQNEPNQDNVSNFLKSIVNFRNIVKKTAKIRGLYFYRVNIHDHGVGECLDGRYKAQKVIEELVASVDAMRKEGDALMKELEALKTKASWMIDQIIAIIIST
ncbi:Hypothetical predicted protein [Olea europaea subsp. europaea]|uniref:Uncharacterized protein n=1 Tax=Olea europaea subsp. europaea TaxID=158383 RepID=A0A8S0T320_OLEEU|nr:Hypothetical predicted protein [Olea europaea subsp. europaea]